MVIRLAKSKSRRNLWIFLLLGLVLASTLYAVGKDQDWFAGGIKDPVVVTPTTYNFIFYNYTSVLDGNDQRAEAKGYLYEKEYDPDTFTEAQKNALTLTDFTLDREIDHNETVTPAANTLYALKVNCTGHGTKWIVPVLGENKVKLRATPTNISLTTADVYGSNTENQTNSVYWYGSIVSLNSDGEIDDGCGYDIAYDFDLMTKWEEMEDSKLYVCLIFDTNGTALEESDFKVTGLAIADIQINSDKIEVYIDENIYGKTDFEFEIDSVDLGVDFELESIALKRGILGGSLTTLASA